MDNVFDNSKDNGPAFDQCNSYLDMSRLQIDPPTTNPTVEISGNELKQSEVMTKDIFTTSSFN